MTAALPTARETPAPPRTAPAFDLAVRVGDGVRGLSRVINVLALLDITPLELTAVEAPGELKVSARIAADGRAARLGLQRLRALPCVRSARLAARNVEAAAFLTPMC